MQLETDILEELNQWGYWAQQCPARSLSDPNTSGLMDVKSGTGLTITDDRAIQIDQAIAKLFHGDEQAIKAIKLRFVCGFDYRAIGKILNVNKDKAKAIVDNSVSWLTGYMAGIRLN